MSVQIIMLFMISFDMTLDIVTNFKFRQVKYVVNLCYVAFDICLIILINNYIVAIKCVSFCLFQIFLPQLVQKFFFFFYYVQFCK